MSNDDTGIVSFRDREKAILAPFAFFSDQSRGRLHPESPHAYRSPFQRDRDRILHSSAFRRLSHKMQVFTGEMGDYHRTRLTHTMEVASIARTMGRALRLNEDLIEALALLHDIGHPPFGHAGEDAISGFLKDEGGFSHNRYALTLVEELEQRYARFPGLNLSVEVLAGQKKRINKAADSPPPMLEVQLVDVADSLAYNAHDVDDAVKLGLVSFNDFQEVPLVQKAAATFRQLDLPPNKQRAALVRKLIGLQVDSVLHHNSQVMANARWTGWKDPVQNGFVITADPEMVEMRRDLETFLYDRVYRHEKLMQVRRNAQQQIQQMLQYFTDHPDKLPSQFQDRIRAVGTARSAADYVAGMTDRFCQMTYGDLSREQT